MDNKSKYTGILGVWVKIKEWWVGFEEPQISIFGNIEDETGIQIHGLLGCSFMEQQKWVLDFEKLCLLTP